MDNMSNINNSLKLSNNINLFNSKHYDTFLNPNGMNHSFDHNAEADYLLSNINSPTNCQSKNNNFLNMSRFEGWINQNPLYKFPNEDNHNNYQVNENNQHELLLKYLNGVDFDKGVQNFDDYKFLDYLLDEKVKNEVKPDNLSDMKVKEKLLGFGETLNRTESKVQSESEKVGGSYITEGTGTIMKIIEASQLWLKHTSAENVPIKLKKQFTKNDNFVVLIKKQFN